MGHPPTADLLAGSTLNPQTLNRYSYVRNDPINLIDPAGLFEICSGRWVGGGVNEGGHFSDCFDFVFPDPIPFKNPDEHGGHGGSDRKPNFSEKELRDRIARALQLAACAAMYGGVDRAIALLNRAAVVNIDLPMMPGANSAPAMGLRELENQNPDAVTATAPLGGNLMFVTNRFFSKLNVDQAATIFLHEMKHQNQKPNHDPNVFDSDRPKDNKEISEKCKTAGEGD